MKDANFLTQKSVLAATALAAEVSNRYALPGPVECEFYRQGLNDTYFVTADDTRFVLRVWRHGWRTDDDVAWELELLRHLKAQGCAVAAPIAATDGMLTWQLAAPEGDRRAALFEFAPGAVKRGKEYTTEDARVFGSSAGELHRGMDSFTSGHHRLAIDVPHLLVEPLRYLERRLRHRPDDLEFIRDLALRLAAEIERRHAEGLSWGICHGDLHGGNVNWRDDVPTHYDFDCGGLGWRAYDIAVFRWAYGLDKELDQQSLWQAFLDGYRSQHALEDRDLDAVPVFVAARHVWLLGLHAQLCATDGYFWLDDAYFDQEIARLLEYDAEVFGGTAGSV